MALNSNLEANVSKFQNKFITQLAIGMSVTFYENIKLTRLLEGRLFENQSNKYLSLLCNIFFGVLFPLLVTRIITPIPKVMEE